MVAVAVAALCVFAEIGIPGAVWLLAAPVWLVGRGPFRLRNAYRRSHMLGPVAP